MPSKKKKYNARFPPARIKKIMQTDEEIGKVAAAVPVIIYISESPGAVLGIIAHKGLSSHPVSECKDNDNITFCIELEQQFDFLKDLVAAVPDMQGEGDENHTEGGEKVPRRGRKPGSGHKNGGAGSKGKDKKLSGTESEQEDDSEDSETDGDEDGSQSSTNLQAASRFHSPTAPPQYMHMGNMVLAGGVAPPQPRGPVAFAPHPSMMSTAPPPPAPALHKTEEEDDDEDYDS